MANKPTYRTDRYSVPLLPISAFNLAPSDFTDFRLVYPNGVVVETKTSGDIVCRPVGSTVDITLSSVPANFRLPWHCSHVRATGTTATLVGIPVDAYGLEDQVDDIVAASTYNFWYDPSDLSTLFEDSAGTTPASIDGPVGLMLDKGTHNLDMIQATTARKPVLRQASNGALYLEVDGVDDFMAVAAGKKAFTNFLHNGLPWTVQIGMRWVEVVADNDVYTMLSNTSGTSQGMNLYIEDRAGSGTSDSFSASILSTSGTLRSFITTANNDTLPPDVDHVVIARHLDLDVDPILRTYVDGVAEATDIERLAPNPADSNLNLALNSRRSDSPQNPIQGRYYGVIGVSEALDDDDLGVVSQYITENLS